MATMYTKTSLKKIKKDDLVQMFLDLQAKKVDHMMDEVVEKCCTDAVEEVVEGMKSVIEEVKEENSDLHNEIKLLKEQIKDLQAELDDVQEEYEAEVNYEDDEVDYYVDAGRKVVLKDGRIVKSKD